MLTNHYGHYHPLGPQNMKPLLIKGLDESPEELRVQAFKALSSGNVNQYV